VGLFVVSCESRRSIEPSTPDSGAGFALPAMSVDPEGTDLFVGEARSLDSNAGAASELAIASRSVVDAGGADVGVGSLRGEDAVNFCEVAADVDQVGREAACACAGGASVWNNGFMMLGEMGGGTRGGCIVKSTWPRVSWVCTRESR
jgi:hypothetical protein